MEHYVVALALTMLFVCVLLHYSGNTTLNLHFACSLYANLPVHCCQLLRLMSSLSLPIACCSSCVTQFPSETVYSLLSFI
jgi:hypothetical protein